MKGQYVHEATLRMERAVSDPVVSDPAVSDPAVSDPAAPGAAITVALCGHWEHPPPCPLAAHHTGRSREGDTVALRTIFTAAAPDEAEVRRRIDGALALGALATPGGATARWALLASGPGQLTAEETEHASRIAGT